MPNFSNYAESGILNFLFRGNSNNFGRPNVLAVALTRNIPAETDNGQNLPELANAGSYARVLLGTPANSLFTDIVQDGSSSGVIDNASAITFPAATAEWGHVSGIAITNSGVYGAGEIIVFGRLTTPRHVLSGDTFQINTGDLDILLG